MQEFYTKLGQNGRMQVPAKCRKLMNLSPGEEIIIIVHDGEASFFSLKRAVNRAQTIMKQYIKKGEKLSDQVIANRKEDAKRE